MFLRSQQLGAGKDNFDKIMKWMHIEAEFCGMLKTKTDNQKMSLWNSY